MPSSSQDKPNSNKRSSIFTLLNNEEPTPSVLPVAVPTPPSASQTPNKEAATPSTFSTPTIPPSADISTEPTLPALPKTMSRVPVLKNASKKEMEMEKLVDKNCKRYPAPANKNKRAEPVSISNNPAPKRLRKIEPSPQPTTSSSASNSRTQVKKTDPVSLKKPRESKNNSSPSELSEWSFLKSSSLSMPASLTPSPYQRIQPYPSQLNQSQPNMSFPIAFVPSYTGSHTVYLPNSTSLMPLAQPVAALPSWYPISPWPYLQNLSMLNSYTPMPIAQNPNFVISLMPPAPIAAPYLPLVHQRQPEIHPQFFSTASSYTGPTLNFPIALRLPAPGAATPSLPPNPHSSHAPRF